MTEMKIAEAKKNNINVKDLLLGKLGTFLGLFILMVVFTCLHQAFLTGGNIRNILIQSGTNAIIAAGMTFVIVSGNIDISVGSMLALSSVVGAKIMLATGSVFSGIIAALVVGIALGVINGILVAFCDFQPFIVSLSTMWLFRGVAYLYTGGQAVTGLPEGMMKFATGGIGFIPYVVVLIVIVYIVCHVVMSQTTFGRKIYAVGDNRESARLSGINVKMTRLSVFVISGFLAALSGIVYMAKLNSGQPIAGQSYEMYAIAAAVIGGASLAKGGIGGMTGTLIGALFISVLQNGLTLLSVNTFWQQVCMGIVVLAAVGLDHFRKNMNK